MNRWVTQESPPAWTQEAYRPRCIKYSICCPVPGGVPHLGYPPSWPDQGVPHLRYPPTLDLAGVPPPIWIWPGSPHWTWLGSPPSGPGQGPPPSGPGQGPPVGPGWGTPPLNLTRVPPSSGPGRGTPSQVLTDKESENITSRLVLRTRSAMKYSLEYDSEWLAILQKTDCINKLGCYHTTLPKSEIGELTFFFLCVCI